ncbi:MAG: hypothetical protein KTR25_06150 [Myxococcales bacterium]|nr:hypothetical protein [Myxococcales bacterium]
MAGWYALVGLALTFAVPEGLEAETTKLVWSKTATQGHIGRVVISGGLEQRRAGKRAVRRATANRAMAFSRFRPVILPKPDVSVAASEVRLRAHLEMLSHFRRTGDVAQAELALSLVEQARDELGAPNAIQASIYLMYEAKKAEQQRDLVQAVRLAQQAVRLSPDVLGLHSLYIKLLIWYHPAQIRQIAQACWHGITAFGRSFRNQVYFVQLTVVILLLGLSSAWTIFAIILLMRYGRYMSSDLAKYLPPFLGTHKLMVGLGLLVSLPLLVPIGWPASVMLGLTLTLAYQRPCERILSGAGVVFFSLSPIAISLLGSILAFAGSRVDHLSVVLEEALTRGSQVTLQQRVTTYPEDGVAQLILGHRAARSTGYEQALHYFEAAARVFSESSYPINNIAVLKYRLGDVDIAEAMLRRVVSWEPCPEVLFNLALMYQNRGKLEQSQALMRRAQKVQSFWDKRFDVSGNKPVEEQLRLVKPHYGVLWRELINEPASSKMLLPLWLVVTGVRSSVWFIPAWGCVALAIGMLGFLSRHRSASCTKCGEPTLICPGEPLQCSQCQSIFASAKAISPITRGAKELQVQNYQRRVTLMNRLAAFVPGGAELFRANQILLGFLVLVSFCGLLSVPTAARWIGTYHTWYLPDGGELYRLLVVGILGIGGLMSAYSLRREAARWR